MTVYEASPPAMVLPAPVAFLEHQLRPQNTAMSQRHVNLVERLDQNFMSAHCALNGVVMDHVVLLVSYCESTMSWRQNIWTQVPGLEAIRNEDILYGKVTIVAIPNFDRSIGVTQQQPMNDELMSSLFDVRQQIPIFVCYIQNEASRKTVATMLWNRITRISGPCSPLIHMRL